jgi:hypothetical protein
MILKSEPAYYYSLMIIEIFGISKKKEVENDLLASLVPESCESCNRVEALQVVKTLH